MSEFEKGWLACREAAIGTATLYGPRGDDILEALRALAPPNAGPDAPPRVTEADFAALDEIRARADAIARRLDARDAGLDALPLDPEAEKRCETCGRPFNAKIMAPCLDCPLDDDERGGTERGGR